MDCIGIIDSIMKSNDLIEAASYLLTISEEALKHEDKKKVVDILKRRLTDAQMIHVSSRFVLPGVNYKNECLIFTDKSAVQQYLALQIDRDLPTVKFIKSLRTLGLKIQDDFTPPSGRSILPSNISAIYNYLVDQLDFTNKIYRKAHPTFILLNNSHRRLNSVTALTDNRNEYGAQFVFLFNLMLKAVDTPEFVFLHELGHVVQNRYGSSDAPPESFHQFIRKKSLEILSTYELCEIFANVFAKVVMYDSPFSQYDDQQEVQDIHVLKEYMWDLIQNG